MTGRERVKAALNFARPDRIPRDLWALPYVSLFRQDELDEVLEKYPGDISRPEMSPGSNAEELQRFRKPGLYEDEWGSVWKVAEPGVLGEVKKPVVEDWSEMPAFEPPWETIEDRDVEAINESCAERDEFMLSAVSARPFERLQFCRGTENVYLDLAVQSDRMMELLNKIHDFYLEDVRNWASSDVDGIFMMDDWGMNKSLLINPDKWREIFKPLYQEYCDIIHESGKYAFFHSDGFIEPIFGDLIEVGMDAINSQLFCMDIEKLAKKYRGKVTFWGEIDRQHILPFGCPKEVCEAVRRVHKALGGEEGGVIAQCEWGKDNPRENIELVFKTWVQCAGGNESFGEKKIRKRRVMKEKRIPDSELDLYLRTLEDSLEKLSSSLCKGKIRFSGLPVDDEWAGPGYAIAALFDPYVLTADIQQSEIFLELPEEKKSPDGINCLETRDSRKERISFVAGGGRTVNIHLPMIGGGVQWNRIKASAEWKPIGKIAEYPAAFARRGSVVFSFNPLRVIHRYLNMADPGTTAGLTDFMIRAILSASELEPDLDENDLRRDFHAFGVSVLMLDQMHRAVGRTWDVNNVLPGLHEAADLYMQGEFSDAEERLKSLFQQLESRRREFVPVPIYVMMMPHGGILFEKEGYAEYDSPEVAARVLNLYLDWSEKFGFRFAPDIGAGTLEEFAKLQPETVSRLRAAWEEGTIEFVNGTYSQPYLQLWRRWDQEKQFEIGLKTFTEIFGRRPAIYAAQEVALHPALPGILNKYGFKHAIHRSQNLGLAPIDNSPLINWQSPDGGAIRALPSHPLRSERRGGELWRHLPILLTSDRNGKLPCIALTSLMDQSFIDIYAEEIVRTHRYAPVWGEFVRPSDFFEKTKDMPAKDTCYTLDEYHYALDLTSNAMSHGHQTGGYSSEHAFIFSESARLQKLEAEGKLTDAELKKLLNQEAHDSYIIPYFAPGYFMEGGLTDYNGPKYRYCTDLPRGTDRFIRDAAGYPESFSDFAPASPETSSIDRTTISAGPYTVKIAPDAGMVIELNGAPCSIGTLKYNGNSFAVENISSVGNKLILSGSLSGYGKARLEYFISGDWLYCGTASLAGDKKWTADRICWHDCVYLEHVKPASAKVIRTVSGMSQNTELEIFHSIDALELRTADNSIKLRHGGNIFFRQTETAVHNRLWCYDEFCDRFWWGVELKTDKKE